MYRNAAFLLMVRPLTCPPPPNYIFYNELSPKNRFQSLPIAALRRYNIQRENLVFKKSLCTCSAKTL